MKNFYLLDKTGHILLSRNYKTHPLDKSVIVGFCSSLPNLCHSLLNEDVNQVQCVESKLVFRFSNDFIFLAHVTNTVSTFLVSIILLELINLFSLFLGPSSIWSERTNFDGCQDIIDMFFLNGLTDPNLLLGGINQLPISKEGRLRLDKLFVYLESVQNVCNNACMLILDGAVVYSRFELKPTRQVLFLHKAKPMGCRTIYWTPIYLTSGWFTLVRLQLSNYTLVVLVQFQSQKDSAISLTQLFFHLIEFQTAFVNARLDIPTEIKPFLIRQFARREALVLLYIHTKSGTVLFPRPRPLSETQTKEVYFVFWSLFGETRSLVAITGTREITVCRDYYRFYSEIDPDYELYLLFTADDVGMDQLSVHVTEVLANIRRLT